MQTPRQVLKMDLHSVLGRSRTSTYKIQYDSAHELPAALRNNHFEYPPKYERPTDV